MKRTGMRVLSFFLAVFLAFSSSAAVTFADARDGQEQTGETASSIKVVTLGFNLSEADVKTIMRFFGASESEATIITITNQDERDHLGAWVPLEQIGDCTYSCAYVCPTSQGGIQVKTANLTYVTSNMIASTLSTSGVVNCDVVAACPFPVSGTGALTGCIMAYETAIGHELDESKKDLATEEMVLTGDLADEVGQEEATLVVNDIKITIIRDNVNGDAEITQAVDTVIANTEAAVAAKAIDVGAPAPAPMGSEIKERLYSFADKVAQMNYIYDEVKFTLQRVTLNITAATGIEDPIVEEFEEDPYVLGEDSILRNTDDSALGDNSNINATNQGAVDDNSAAEGYDSMAAGDRVSLQLLRETTDERFADGTNLLMHRNADGTYSLTDVNGTPVTDSGYYSFYEDDGYLTVRLYNEELNNYGLMDRNGNMVIPAVYGDVVVENGRFAAGLVLVEADETDYEYKSWNGEHYYQIQTADIYALNGTNLSPSLSLSRAEYEDSYAQGSCLNIQSRSDGTVTTYDAELNPIASQDSIYSFRDVSTEDYEIYRENGRYGVKDLDGNVLIAPAFSNIYEFHNGFAEVYNGSSYGLADRDGTLVVPMEYDDVRYNYYGPDALYGTDKSLYDANGYFAVVKDGNIGFVSWDGGVETCPPVYDRYEYDINGAVLLSKADDGTITVVSADGAENVLAPEYASANVLDYGSGMLIRATNTDSRFELLDWHGTPILSGDFVALRLSGDGKYLLAQRTYSDPCVIYEVAYETAEKHGIELEQEEAVAVVSGDGPTATGITLTEIGEKDVYGVISGTNLMQVSGADGYGIADLDGNLLTDTIYSYSMYEDSGYVTGELNGDDLNQNGLFNQNGEVVVPFIYGDVRTRGNNWVLGYILEMTDKDEGDYSIWTRDGEKHADIVQVDVYFRPEAGKAPVASLSHDEYEDCYYSDYYLNIQNRTDGTITTYDSSFNAVQQEDSIYTFKDLQADEYVYFRDNGHQGVMDREGNIVVPASFRYVDGYYYGYAIVNDGEKKGLMNPNGELVLPVIFDRIYRSYSAGDKAGFDSHGYFMALLDGEFVFAKAGGEVTCHTGVDQSGIYNYDGVTALIKDDDDNYTLVAADGVITKMDGFRSLYDVDGTGGMMLKGYKDSYSEFYVMDWHGNLLLPTDTNAVEATADGRYLLVEDSSWNHILYEISYGMEEGSTEETAATENAPAAEAETEPASEAETEPAAEAETVPAAEAETEPASEAETASAAELLDEAIALLDNAGEDFGPVAEKLMTANDLLPQDGSASSVLQSALSLIGEGAADADVLKTLVEAAKSLLTE